MLVCTQVISLPLATTMYAGISLRGTGHLWAGVERQPHFMFLCQHILGFRASFQCMNIPQKVLTREIILILGILRVLFSAYEL